MGTPSAIAALNRRAPSMWTGRPSPVSQLAHGREVVFVQHRAAAAVVRVLETDQAGAREVLVVAADRCLYRSQVETPAFVIRHRAQTQAADGPGAAYLEDQRMRLLADDHLVAPAGVRQQRREVALRPAGREKRRLFAQPLRRHLLKPIDRRVFAEDVVAQLRVRHRLAHFGRRQRDGIAAQVDDLHAVA